MLLNRLNGKCQLKPLSRKQKMKRILFFVLVLLGIAQVSNGQVAVNWIDLYEPLPDGEMPYRLMKPMRFNSNKRYPIIVSCLFCGTPNLDRSQSQSNYNQLYRSYFHHCVLLKT